jgi:hypothetical protein
VSRFWSLAALVVGGIMLADILTHPRGTQAAANGLASIVTPTESALLGGNTVGGK